MKNILIAAAIVGAATAGAILYLKNRNMEDGGSKRIKGAASKAYDTMNAGLGKVERLSQHSMD